MTSDSPPSGGFTLAKLGLDADKDLVSLSRRTRRAGEDFGLHPRDVRSLSAATYEAARLMYGRGAVEVEVRLAEGPSLQVVFRLRIENATERAALKAQLEGEVRTLASMVDDIQVVDKGGDLSLCLRTLFPTVATERLNAWASPLESAAPNPVGASIPEAELRQRYDALDHSFQELQAELHETNRGVVALHADLEANADKLRQAEDRLRLLLDSVQDYAICMLTPNGEVASWNAGGERLFGYAADEIIGRHFACFYEPAERDLDIPAEHLRVAEERGRFAAECLRVKRGGAAFDAHVIMAAVRRGRERELRGFSLVVRDITERKRLEDDLRRRAEELSAANRAKEDFLATLSHELRTPLNAMLGWTRLLRMGKLDGAAMARALDTIERNAHIQEQLIADILDLSRIVTGKLRVELRPMSLAPVVDAAIDAVRPAAEAKGIRLVSHVSYEGAVLGDPDRLQQVVWNLLVNAIKFTPAPGAISVTTARIAASAVITVTDTGEGISQELLPFIFDRFRQGDASSTRPHGGLGLGLSIVRHIVELHGGKVVAQSEGHGHGATFMVQLPVPAIHRYGDSRIHRGTRDDEHGHPLAGVKVLVVDDDADAREVVSTALAQCGARTAAVASAREALQMISAFNPDVLVSDIGMPGEDGCAFIRRLRASGEGAAMVPAVALTAYTEAEAGRRALLAGFQEFVQKPVQIDELAALVRTLSERRT